MMRQISRTVLAGAAVFPLIVGCSTAVGPDQLALNNPRPALHDNHAPATSSSDAPVLVNVPDAKKPAKPKATSPEQLLSMLGEYIVAKDVDGVISLQEPEAAIVDFDLTVIRGHDAIRAFYVEWFKSSPVLNVNPLQTVMAGGTRVGNSGKLRNRSASVMGDYTLEQDAGDGTRISFAGNFCDIVREQQDGTWLYVQDNPYPPHTSPSATGGEAQARVPHH